MKRAIVTFEEISFHMWGKAPPDIFYLNEVHRHKFYFTVTIDVGHNDREIEYHQFQKYAHDVAKKVLANLTITKSCEDIAGKMLEIIGKKYPGRYISIKVMEDNENGALLDNRREDDLVPTA